MPDQAAVPAAMDVPDSRGRSPAIWSGDPCNVAMTADAAMRPQRHATGLTSPVAGTKEWGAGAGELPTRLRPAQQCLQHSGRLAGE